MSENFNYRLNPEEAGVALDTVGNPTSKGWQVVSPDCWHFMINQMADKVQTVEGYSDPDFCMDCTKAMIVVDVYNENPWGSPGELHAEVLKRYLETQNIVIRDRELIVGNWGNDEHGLVFDPRSDLWFAFQEFVEYGKAFYWEKGEKIQVKKDDKLYKDVEEFCNRWNLVFVSKPYMTDQEYRMYVEGGQRYWEQAGTTGLRANPDHEWYMNQGLRKLQNMMKNTVERLEKECAEATGAHFVDLKERIDDCRSSVKATEAVINWIKRHGKVAKDLAKNETDPKERERLETIAAGCEWVSENPPRNFREMMQLHWLSFEAHYLIEHASHTVTFRPDQTWWSWYERDVIKDKTLSRDEAADIISFYFMKYHEIGLLTSLKEFRASGMGTRDYSVLTLGGQKSDGSDATNDLTMLILDVIDGYRFHFPDVKIRWHNKFDKNNLKRVVEVMRTGMGSPSLKNDNIAIPEMMNHYGSMNLEEARSWAVVGCNTPGITINSRGAHRRSARCINSLKSVEFTLHNGRDGDPEWGWVKSVETGDPVLFKTWEEFYQAWLKQWHWLIREGLNLRNISDRYFNKIIRRPFLSNLYKKCIEEGIDIMNADVPWLSFYDAPGWVDTMDSLAAVKYWIYDKKKYTMAQLVEALKADWEGFDDMRRDFKDAPKFGNNDDFVDEIFARATSDVSDIGSRCLDLRNEPGGYPSGINITWMYALAPHCCAAPNGRKYGEALSDGGINPHAEFDRSGAWDRVASALKVDQSKFKAWIYNQKFDYSSVGGEAGLEKLFEYTLAGLEGGMDQMQYNMVSRDVLKDAQINPQKYPHLAVRISGYSAHFTSLPEFVQNAVIERVDHEL